MDGEEKKEFERKFQDATAGVDGLTELAQGATAIHELYTAYVEAGFRPRQVLYLIGSMMSPHFGQAPGEE